MVRDMAKKTISDLRYQYKTYRMLGVKVRLDSGIWEALAECQKQTGLAPATYAQAALREKLIVDGYLPTPEAKRED